MFTFFAPKSIAPKFIALLLAAVVTGSITTAKAASGGERAVEADRADVADLVSSDDVSVYVLDADRLAEMNSNKTDGISGTDIFYAHGNTSMLEANGTYTLKNYGYGSMVNSTATNAPKYAWVHFSVPTPVKIASTSGKLKRIFISADMAGTIVQVDVWDGANRILSKGTPGTTGNMLNAPLVIEFATPVTVTKGLGVSVKVGGCIFDEGGCVATKNQFAAVGAEFTR